MPPGGGDLELQPVQLQKGGGATTVQPMKTENTGTQTINQTVGESETVSAGIKDGRAVPPRSARAPGSPDLHVSESIRKDVNSYLDTIKPGGVSI